MESDTKPSRPRWKPWLIGGNALCMLLLGIWVASDCVRQWPPAEILLPRQSLSLWMLSLLTLLSLIFLAVVPAIFITAKRPIVRLMPWLIGGSLYLSFSSSLLMLIESINYEATK